MGKFLDSTGLTKLVELIKGSLPGKATSSTLGLVKPDNSTITVDSDGTMAWGLSDRIVAGNSGNKSLVLCSTTKTDASANGALSIASGSASGIASIAHGFATVASADYSVATGKSKASGNYSHAENKGVAKGLCSHAEGYATAGSSYQHAEGKFNIEDANGIFQHIVGAGAKVSSPSTISAGDWNGNKYLAGNLYVGCNDFTTTANGLTTANAGGSKVATESYVDTAIANLPSGSSFSGSYNDLTDKPTLFSGDYNDLSNKPTIPSAYTLPTASTSTLGGVKIDGSTITIDANGVISTGFNLTYDNSTSGLTATTYKTAIDEVVATRIPDALVSTETAPAQNGIINWVYG